ncbi:Histone deacetylase 8 [Grifola frondosa]|uniref:Histone deacetylase 8 n=1 Tax=Grifola frondosa TaxID=5627 RepID=A0A1C7MM50_GRIFR|nr:Histone deacetylase 8 [Grifola frondosa]
MCTGYLNSKSVELARSHLFFLQTIARTALLVHSLNKTLCLLSLPSLIDGGQIRLIRPFLADDKILSAYHSRDYLQAVLDSTAHTLRDDQGNISICWDGGRHHAQKAQASGFCYVADCVLAILALKQSQESPHDSLHAEPRIMYLAFDLHFSDGGSQAFYSSGSTSSTPQVLTFSIHQTAPDPSDPSFNPFTLSIPLARGASNATFARIWPAVERVNQAFDRDYIAVQCGAGGLTGDPYAVWNWSLGVAEGSISGCIEQICLVRIGRPLSLDADIPDHSAFPAYEPSFILDVPQGNAQDHNTDEYPTEVTRRFCLISEKIEVKMSCNSTELPT